MQRVPAARFGRNECIEGMPHFALERLERIDRLGACWHFFDEHRRRAKAHRHRNASVIRQFIEREQRNRTIVGHALLRNEDAHIGIATAARRHNGRAHRNVFNFLFAQVSHGAFLSLYCTVVLKRFDKEYELGQAQLNSSALLPKGPFAPKVSEHGLWRVHFGRKQGDAYFGTRAAA